MNSELFMGKKLEGLPEILKESEKVGISEDYLVDRCRPRPGHTVWFCNDYGKDCCPKTCDYALGREK